MVIKAEQILNIPENELSNYYLYLSAQNGVNLMMSGNLGNTVNVKQIVKEEKESNRPHVFFLMPFFNEPNKWLFGGIFSLSQTTINPPKNGTEYTIESVPLHKEMIGRLVIDFFRHPGMRGSQFPLEHHYKEFVISEMLKKPFEGNYFPGYEKVNLDFSQLENIFHQQKADWKNALEKIKGIYLITDTANGKKYVDAATGNSSIWKKWGGYLGMEITFNNELTRLISGKGSEYAKSHLQFSLLEYVPLMVDDSLLEERRAFWKRVLLAREPFGYNKN